MCSNGFYFSHSFNDLTRILYEIGKYDSVIGSRYIVGGATEGWGLYRRLLSKYANKVSKIVLKSNINDLIRFKLLHKEVVSKIMETKPKSNGYTFQIEINQIIEKPFHNKRGSLVLKNEFQEVKMNYRIIIEAIYFLSRQFLKIKLQ